MNPCLRTIHRFEESTFFLSCFILKLKAEKKQEIKTMLAWIILHKCWIHKFAPLSLTQIPRPVTFLPHPEIWTEYRVETIWCAFSTFNTQLKLFLFRGIFPCLIHTDLTKLSLGPTFYHWVQLSLSFYKLICICVFECLSTRLWVWEPRASPIGSFSLPPTHIVPLTKEEELNNALSIFTIMGPQ